MRSFLAELEARLERDGFLSGNQKAAALGVHPATWSRARKGTAKFSRQIVQAGIRRYPELALYLSAALHATSPGLTLAVA